MENDLSYLFCFVYVAMVVHAEIMHTKYTFQVSNH